ncbi:hypothetical protein J2W97_004784 [Paenibacillus jamilae]|jgi:hypothetical protein|uniref:hypothetical protein n=1 Tax=Paenibacillus polymyxa TaxID=1406 RepID=UPI000D2FAAC2|nr:hypothetical protein [Paenibacillus polymyxa]MDP9678730.1 hypothetical protein [Paenibacillus jamilae]MBY0022458.1 hypothetical protein [Paenibacillus polymyxa]MBY0058580.1 hypothetical protein [Paenibacillus polymyxa]MBY0072111.1 hypothetical protein [Paenibacillus polymyxa]MBY0082917.1 hypothetical protein [Paenibacillus polymyxa]
MNSAYEMLEARISEWGISNDEIIAIYIVGSRAREKKPLDEFSDSIRREMETKIIPQTTTISGTPSISDEAFLQVVNIRV